MRALPSDLEALDRARGSLSTARDWLNSDTSDAIAGRRTRETAELIANALFSIGAAKSAIDGAKDAALERRRGR